MTFTQWQWMRGEIVMRQDGLRLVVLSVVYSALSGREKMSYLFTCHASTSYYTMDLMSTRLEVQCADRFKITSIIIYLNNFTNIWSNNIIKYTSIICNSLSYVSEIFTCSCVYELSWISLRVVYCTIYNQNMFTEKNPWAMLFYFQAAEWFSLD